MTASGAAGGALLVLIGVVFVGMGWRQRVPFVVFLGVLLVIVGVGSALGVVSLDTRGG